MQSTINYNNNVIPITLLMQISSQRVIYELTHCNCIYLFLYTERVIKDSVSDKRQHFTIKKAEVFFWCANQRVNVSEQLVNLQQIYHIHAFVLSGNITSSSI